MENLEAMAERFTERLHGKAAAIWEAQHQHPFVRGISDGTLTLDRFQFWLRQDYVFLIEYSRLLALAAARSPDLETMVRFATLLKETVDTEMHLHRSYAAEFDISPKDLEQEPPAPVTRAYTDFLLRLRLREISPSWPLRYCPACGPSAKLASAWRRNPLLETIAMPSGLPRTVRKSLPSWLSGAANCSIVLLQVCPNATCRGWKQRFSPVAVMNGSFGRWLGRWNGGRYD